MVTSTHFCLFVFLHIQNNFNMSCWSIFILYCAILFKSLIILELGQKDSILLSRTKELVFWPRKFVWVRCNVSVSCLLLGVALEYWKNTAIIAPIDSFSWNFFLNKKSTCRNLIDVVNLTQIKGFKWEQIRNTCLISQLFIIFSLHVLVSM